MRGRLWTTRGRRPRVTLVVVLAVVAVTAATLVGACVPSQLRGIRGGRSESFPPEQSRSGVQGSPQRHRLARDVPTYISVPSVGIAARVIPVGATKAGAMKVTVDPHITDWFSPGAYPGDQGSAVIAGHSGYQSSSAAFDQLKRVRLGTVVYVKCRSGERLAFKVISTHLYRADEKVPAVFDRSDGAYLNLIGCTGSWDASLGTHSQRLVVFTRLVE